MTVYAVPMHPNFVRGFSQHTVTPYVCFQCGNEACAVNDEDPLRTVLHWEGPSNERWEVPAIEIGVRCIRENAGQSGAPTVQEREQYRALLAEAAESIEAKEVALAAAEELADAATDPYRAIVKEELDKVVRIAALAGANAVRKDAANGAAS